VNTSFFSSALISFPHSFTSPKICKENWAANLRVVILVSLLTSVLCFWVPWFAGGEGFACHLRPNSKVNSEDTDEEAAKFWFNFNCPREDQINDLASILLGNREAAIKQILSVQSCKEEQKFGLVSFSWQSMLVMNVLGLPLMMAAFGCAFPMGIFMPSILIGSCMGTAVARFVCNKWPDSQIGQESGMMALMGAVALLGGIQRSTISLCVIILEGTGQIQYLLPIIWTTVVARYAGNYFNEGLYEVAQHVKNFPFLEHGISRAHLANKTVEEVMSSPVQTLAINSSLNEIKDMIVSCPHNGFPIVNEEGRLEGIVLRCQLSAILGYEYKRDLQRLSSAGGENPLGKHGPSGDRKANGYDGMDDEVSGEECDPYKVDSISLTRSRATLSFIDSMTVPGTRPSYVEAMDKSVDKDEPKKSKNGRHKVKPRYKSERWDPVAATKAASEGARGSKRSDSAPASAMQADLERAEKSRISGRNSNLRQVVISEADEEGNGMELDDDELFEAQRKESRLSELIRTKDAEDEIEDEVLLAGKRAQEEDEFADGDMTSPLLQQDKGASNRQNSSIAVKFDEMLENTPRLLDGVIKRNLGGFATISNISEVDVRFSMAKVRVMDIVCA
jgi:hypothetical protein